MRSTIAAATSRARAGAVAAWELPGLRQQSFLDAKQSLQPGEEFLRALTVRHLAFAGHDSKPRAIRRTIRHAHIRVVLRNLSIRFFDRRFLASVHFELPADDECARKKSAQLRDHLRGRT